MFQERQMLSGKHNLAERCFSNTFDVATKVTFAERESARKLLSKEKISTEKVLFMDKLSCEKSIEKIGRVNEIKDTANTQKRASKH